jgi:hypothetical protein
MSQTSTLTSNLHSPTMINCCPMYGSYSSNQYKIYTVKPVLRGHLWDQEKVALKDSWPLIKGSIYIKFSMTGQEKVNL